MHRTILREPGKLWPRHRHGQRLYRASGAAGYRRPRLPDPRSHALESGALAAHRSQSLPDPSGRAFGTPKDKLSAGGGGPRVVDTRAILATAPIADAIG